MQDFATMHRMMEHYTNTHICIYIPYDDMYLSIQIPRNNTSTRIVFMYIHWIIWCMYSIQIPYSTTHSYSSTTFHWLVVSTPLKNISQLGWLFPTYGKIKKIQTTNQNIIQPQQYQVSRKKNAESPGTGWMLLHRARLGQGHMGQVSRWTMEHPEILLRSSEISGVTSVADPTL